MNKLINVSHLLSTSQIEEDDIEMGLGTLIECQLEETDATFTLTPTEDPLVFDLIIEGEFGDALEFLG